MSGQGLVATCLLAQAYLLDIPACIFKHLKECRCRWFILVRETSKNKEQLYSNYLPPGY